MPLRHFGTFIDHIGVLCGRCENYKCKQCDERDQKQPPYLPVAAAASGDMSLCAPASSVCDQSYVMCGMFVGMAVASLEVPISPQLVLSIDCCCCYCPSTMYYVISRDLIICDLQLLFNCCGSFCNYLSDVFVIVVIVVVYVTTHSLVVLV